MNLKLLQIATVKAKHFSGRLRRRFDKKSHVALQDWLTWFEVIGYTIQPDLEISVGGYRAEESNHFETVLRDRLYKALKQINPKVSADAIKEAMSQIICIQSGDLFESNQIFHQYLIGGIDVAYQNNNRTVSEKVWLIDPFNLLNNDWLVTYSFNLIERGLTRYWDAIVFINGLPLAVIVCTDISSRNATFKQVYQEFQSYKQQNHRLFVYNEFLAMACGERARIGTLTSHWEEFQPWRTIDGESFPHQGETELEVLIQGIFDKRRFTELLKHFILFKRNGSVIDKQLLRYPFCTVPHLKVSG